MPQQIVIAEHLRIAALLTDARIDELIVAQGSYQIGRGLLFSFPTTSDYAKTSITKRLQLSILIC
ncbi:MAG: hypothetical protein CMH01_10095 [Marinovum sp.]|nr:hypothetical protein [Marinovum sp.]